MSGIGEAAAGRSICVLVGSPRRGVSLQAAQVVAEGVRGAGARCGVFSLAEHVVFGCDGCGSCLDASMPGCVLDGRDGDAFVQLKQSLDASDGLVVVSPVYFSGPPSQLKAVYDRFQERWARRYVHGEQARDKRPACLVVVGEGGDPFGYEPLVTITRSVLNIAGFRLGDVLPVIGSPSSDALAKQETALRTLGFELVVGKGTA